VGVSEGHRIARAWCSSFHAVEADGRVRPFADIPSFTDVARLASTTAAELHAFLTTPHGDMPDIKLNNAEIDAIVAYILGLRKQ
jgi:cytochrome c